MDKILKKLFTKYYIFKVQTEWKDELKKIPEKDLKLWMDNDLFIKIKELSESLADDVIRDADLKWDNDLWMDINDFVNEQADTLEEKNADDDEYWNTEDDDKPTDEPEEVQLMICPEADVTCDCDHSEIHPHTIGCETGCQYSQHFSCDKYDEEDEIPPAPEPVPDEIVETGGV